MRHGRIYRLVPDDAPKQPAPKMLDEATEQLVAHLAHPNGWWRDQAQKLIVTRGGNEAVPALNRMAAEHESPDARICALWALQGLGALQPEPITAALGHAHPRVRRAVDFGLRRDKRRAKRGVERGEGAPASLTNPVTDPTSPTMPPV